MKNYKVIATRYFKDSNEIDEKTGLKVERKVNDEFYCTKERYEFLKANNAVKLVEIIETIKIEPKETKPIKFVEKEITEEEVQETEKLAKGGIIEGKAKIAPEIGEVIIPITKPKKKKTSKK